MAAQVKFRQEIKPTEGLRSRKKLRTQLTIEEAALGLFAEHGYDATTVEQISQRADISTATFFRYFPSKADVILCQEGAQLPLLKQAILDRPADESDLTAVRSAFRQVWVPAIDPERTMRAGRAVAGSAVLRALYGDISRTWLIAISEALAQRHNLSEEDERSKVAARVALAIFNGAVQTWTAGGCREDLGNRVECDFDMAMRLCADSIKAGSRRKGKNGRSVQ